MTWLHAVLIGALLGGVTLAGVYLQGGKDARAKAAVKIAETRIKTIQKSQEITDEVHSLDDGALGAELYRRLSGAGPE